MKLPLKLLSLFLIMFSISFLTADFSEAKTQTKKTSTAKVKKVKKKKRTTASDIPAANDPYIVQNEKMKNTKVGMKYNQDN